MALEIERKFLVIGDDWRRATTGNQSLRDGLLAQFGGGKLRVRLDESRAWLTIKGPRHGRGRLEYEYEIPRADAEEMLLALCDGRTIEKTRYFVPHDHLIWIVDVYGAALDGLVIAEVELQHAHQVVTLPSWVGREVTDDPRFKKTNFQKYLPVGPHATPDQQRDLPFWSLPA